MREGVPPPGPEETTAIRRAARKVQLPLVSGRASVLVLVACFLIAAVAVLLLGWTLHLPAWIDFEIMLALWWLVWVVALALLLYRGVRLSDDQGGLPGPRNWLRASSGGGNWGGGELGSIGDVEGCLLAIGLVLAAIAMVLLAWVLIEIVVPLLSLVLYALIRGMLARIVNDEHGCGGRFGKALLWGTVWATVYTAPLALLVWVVHLIVTYKTTGLA